MYVVIYTKYQVSTHMYVVIYTKYQVSTFLNISVQYYFWVFKNHTLTFKLLSCPCVMCELPTLMISMSVKQFLLKQRIQRTFEH